jgi:hypothetical protein
MSRQVVGETDLPKGKAVIANRAAAVEKEAFHRQIFYFYK